MALFDIDYGALVPQMLPVKLRSAIMTAWLQCLITPVKWLYGFFSVNRTANLYVLAHDGQVCYLEAALNDTFDNTGRGIYITDGPFRDPLFLYTVPEAKPLWLGLVSEEGTTTYPDPEWLFTDIETYTFGVCFIIHVPSAVVFDTAHLRALTDKYRLPGRSNYTIVTF